MQDVFNSLILSLFALTLYDQVALILVLRVSSICLQLKLKYYPQELLQSNGLY